MYLAIAVTGNK